MIILLFLLSLNASAEVILNAQPDKPIYNQCVDCHRTKSYTAIRKKYQPLLRHDNIHLEHGRKEMSCNFCHDKNNHNLLMQYEDHTATFREPSGVCSQCHADVFKNWNLGIHGKRVGGWKGARTQFHCTQCHNPHSVPFSKMIASPAPPRPRLGISKEH